MQRAYKRIMLGRAGAEMPGCKRNQFAIRYDRDNSKSHRHIPYFLVINII